MSEYLLKQVHARIHAREARLRRNTQRQFLRMRIIYQRWGCAYAP